MLNRWIEPDLLDALGELGAGCIVFSPLAQGLLTDRYLDGIPADSRAARDGSLRPAHLTEENLARVRALNDIAARRGQTLAQLAIAWVLRDERVTSALIGASSVAQLEDNLAALANRHFIDRRAGRDRPLRRRRRHQPLGAFEHRLRLRLTSVVGQDCLTRPAHGLRGTVPYRDCERYLSLWAHTPSRVSITYGLNRP